MDTETVKTNNLEACRVCANFYLCAENNNFVDLFESPDELKNEIEFILKQLHFWNVKVERNDGLSQLICVDCLTKFCSIDDFRKECEDAQQRLLQSVLDSIQIQLGKEQSEAHSNLDDGYEVPSTIHNGEDQIMENVNSSQVSSTNIDLNTIGGNTNEINTNDNLHVQSQECLNENPIILSNVPAVGIIKQSGQSKEICSDDIEDILQGNIIIKTTSESNKENMMMQDWENIIDEANSDVGNFSDGDDLDDESPMANNLLACQYCYCSVDEPNNHIIFPDAESLSQHLLTVHDPSQPFTCPYCSLTYKSIKLRDNHVQFHHNTNRQTNKCAYCQKVLRGSIKTHENNSCSYIGDWQCEVCDFKLIQKPLYRFRAHQKCHIPEKKFYCNICQRSFMRRYTLEAHKKVHLPSKSNPFHCNVCSKGFRSEYEINRHNYQVHNGDFPVKCNYCHKGFVSNAFLHRHLENFHPETMDSIKCSNCGAQFSSILKMRFHLQRPRDENGNCISTKGVLKEKRSKFRRNNFQCSYCSKYFYNRIQLEKHLVSHDPNERPFQCEQCNLRCRSMIELNQHARMTHLKKYKCELCEKCFIYRKELRDHMLYHTELSLHCTESNCEFECSTKSTLDEHVRQMHDYIPCEYCGSSFIRENLIKHFNEVHRSEIDIDITDVRMGELTDSPMKSIASLETPSKVLVEYVNEKSNETSNLLTDQVTNSFSGIEAGDDHFNDYFMDNLIDPENEIIVT